jgi:hypothetical protein
MPYFQTEVNKKRKKKRKRRMKCCTVLCRSTMLCPSQLQSYIFTNEQKKKSVKLRKLPISCASRHRVPAPGLAGRGRAYAHRRSPYCRCRRRRDCDGRGPRGVLRHLVCRALVGCRVIHDSSARRLRLDRVGCWRRGRCRAYHGCCGPRLLLEEAGQWRRCGCLVRRIACLHGLESGFDRVQSARCACSHDGFETRSCHRLVVHRRFCLMAGLLYYSCRAGRLHASWG